MYKNVLNYYLDYRVPNQNDNLPILYYYLFLHFCQQVLQQYSANFDKHLWCHMVFDPKKMNHLSIVHPNKFVDFYENFVVCMQFHV